MLRLRSALPSVGLGFLGFALLVAAPVRAQAPQFRADVTSDGDEPFEGTMFFGNQRMRIEGTSDGEPFTAIINGQANSIIVLMPEDQVYMTMDLGSAPFSAPAVLAMDPANPCASGEVTECRSLGTETVNGYAARGWEYTRDGERETAWISNELRFPVRTVEADGSTTDLTNVEMGPQPAALFEPPAGYTAMAMPGFGGRAGRGQVPPAVGRGQAPTGGRGQAAGRGAVPPTGRGQAAGRGAAQGAAGGVDPAQIAQLTAQLQAMGLPPDQIAMAVAQLQASAATLGTDYSAWEAGDGWVADLVVTASGSETEALTGSLDRGVPGQFTATYSARYTASVPITYGTPGAGGRGPAWQLVPTLGSPRGLAEPLTFSGTTEYRSETTYPATCNDPNPAYRQDGVRTVVEARGSAQLSISDHNSTEMAMQQGASRFEISGDLSTFALMAGAGTAAPETITTTTTHGPRCPNSSSENGTETQTSEQRHTVAMNLTDLPLAASPGPMSGTATVPMQFEIGNFSGELQANVEWTLRPIQ